MKLQRRVIQENFKGEIKVSTPPRRRLLTLTNGFSSASTHERLCVRSLVPRFHSSVLVHSFLSYSPLPFPPVSSSCVRAIR
jgi:hypothetical protein